MAQGVISNWKSRLRTLSRLLPILCMFSLAATTAHAQAQAINGNIRGRVTDPEGAAVPGARVTATNTGTGYTRSGSSSTDGYYVLPNLPLGTYTVTFTKQGFATLTTPNVSLQAGTEAVINGKLKVGAVSTTVTVTGGAPILEPSSVSIGRTISNREVTNLPLISRNPYNFILYQPGVSGHPNPELGVPRTLNTNGQLDRIHYEMDGMADTESDQYGLRLFPISNSYVREVQTVANSFAPEFGETTGDTYNVITESGTNTFHGLFHWISRPASTSARPMLLAPSQKKPDLSVTDFVINAGGPIIKNKLFYFGSYEHMRRGGPNPITITAANAQAIGLPASELVTPPAEEHATFADARLDWTINSKNQAFLRLNYFRNEYPYNSDSGGLYALDAAADFHDRAYIIGTQIVSSIRPNLLNEFRFSWPYRHEIHTPGAITGPGPVINISGVAIFNGTTAAGHAFDEKQPSFNDNLTWTHGAHTFKQGVYVDQILDNQTSNGYSEFNFASIADYLAAKSGANPYSYSSLHAILGNTNAGYHSLFWGFYWQDSWQVRPTVTLIYGIRYDKFQPPAAEANAPFIYSRHFDSPSGNFQPRIGVAWEATPKTVVRVSFGKFYGAPSTNLWFNSLSNDGSGRSIVATVVPSEPFAPAFPNTITSLPTLPPQDVTTIAPNFKDPYVLTSSLRVSRELTPNDSLSVGYVVSEGHQLTWLHNINLINPIGQLADGRPIFSSAVNSSTRMDPRFNNIMLQSSGANSNYNAMIVDYKHRWSHGLEMSANFTWSHTLSDAPDVNAFEQSAPVEDPTNRNRDYGNSLVNRPVSFNLSTVYNPTFSLDNPFLKQIANGNTFAFLVVAQSGDAQNITSATAPLNGDSSTTSVTRPLFVGRDTVRGPKIVEFDTRYTRNLFTWRDRVTTQFLFEVNNLFNDHHNITFLNTTVPVNAAGYPLLPNGNIGLPTSFPFRATVLEARILQFGLAVRW